MAGDGGNGYDPLGRLTQTKDGATDVAIETYAYDATGNRTEQSSKRDGVKHISSAFARLYRKYIESQPFSNQPNRAACPTDWPVRKQGPRQVGSNVAPVLEFPDTARYPD